MPGQVVDAETAQEFMRETLEVVEAEVLAGISAELATKSGRLQELLEPNRLERADPGDLRTILRFAFSTRRKADAILDSIGPTTLARGLDELLRGTDELTSRFEAFQAQLVEFPGAAYELPSEVLHFAQPDTYWLWTRWMWDPGPETGALALVTEDDFDLDDITPGRTYLRVGEAVAFVSATGASAGFAAFDDGPFAVDVFLACVYTVYMYTVLRLRMTQEFNRIVPQQPELIRRLLGVHQMEV